MEQHGRAVRGCTQAPASFVVPQDCRLTYNPETNRLYVHVFAWPFRHLHLDGFAGKVTYAQLLSDASEIHFAERALHQSRLETIPQDTLILQLPVQKPDVAVPVIELFLA